jgi:hypothetical protein
VVQFCPFKATTKVRFLPVPKLIMNIKKLIKKLDKIRTIGSWKISIKLIPILRIFTRTKQKEIVNDEIRSYQKRNSK